MIFNNTIFSAYEGYAIKISLKKRKIGYVYNSVAGDFSFNGLKLVGHESKLEKNFLILASFSSSVVNIIEQPFTILYQHNNKEREYTPDYLIYFNEDENGFQPKPLLVEVKPRKVLMERFSEFKPKLKAAFAYCRQENMRFKIYDEQRIYNTSFNNIKFLKRYARLEYANEEAHKIVKYLDKVQESTITEILDFLGVSEQERSLSLGHIYQLLYKKILLTDFSETIDLHTVIWSNQS